MGLSTGLDIATRALRAHQMAVDVTSHNIANAATPGYSRQEVLLQALGNHAIGFRNGDQTLANVGMGVDAAGIRRLRDVFIDFQIRQINADVGRYTVNADTLEQVEIVFNEPSDSTLNRLLANFWNAWRGVSNEPESTAARASLIETAGTLASTLNRAEDQLQTIRRDLNTKVGIAVNEVNQITSEIATLNQQIAQLQVTGNAAADLRDRRDLLLDRLSTLADISYLEDATGSVTVYLGNRELVVRDTAMALAATPNPGNSNFFDVTFVSDGQVAQIRSGELYGLLDMRDTMIPAKLGQLNSLASTLITEVNNLHVSGFGLNGATGLNFFAGADASDIAVDPAIASSPASIAAASAAGSPGDGSRALQIAQLQQALLMNSGTVTIDGFYQAMIAELGVNVREAQGLRDNQKTLAEHLTGLRESTAAVSLDEEMTNLVKHQRAYEAAARLVTVVDEMLDKLINGTGAVGR
ncbi:MAG TPA: flagellar hook-associated protein FlgK [Dehalococcoidia bacterium]